VESADGASGSQDIGLTEHPLPRLALGSLTRDQVTPILTFDAGVVRDITDRAVLGLIGQQIYRDRALVVDYVGEQIALVPSARSDGGGDAVANSRAALAPALRPRALPTPFRLAGDGKVVVTARVRDDSPSRRSKPLTLIVDTGSSKTVFFERSLAEAVRGSRRWPSLRGLTAPTLVGPAAARIARVPSLELEPAAGTERGAALRGPHVEGGDVVLADSPLQDQLSRVTGTEIHGLLGYSFLRHFRVIIDYPNRVLWLDPLRRPSEERPNEYSHVGIQIERRDGAARVVAVAVGSPADRAGIRVGDEVVAVDGMPIESGRLIELSRRLEGPPGSRVRLTLRRDGIARELQLRRARLL
jgi:hypothetical protein